MKTQLNDQLIKNNSKLFDGTSGFPAYVECDDGWYDIIDAALSTIQGHITNRNNQILNNIEWHAKRDIGEPIPDWRRETELLEYPQVQQIKEKFGGLRIYLSYEDDYIHGIVNMAEAIAARTCEVCGAHGERRGGSWLKTLCDKHHEERERHIAWRKRKETHAPNCNSVLVSGRDTDCDCGYEEAWEQAIK